MSVQAVAFALAAALVCASPTGSVLAADPAGLYTSDAIVTGTGEINREIGFRECLGEMLLKLSGDPTIVDAQGFQAIQAKAGSFVSSFSYRDRLEGIPIHDEQGTHDRPHDLTCHFEPSTANRLLADLGRKPWLAPRPAIAVLLAVHDQKHRFVLSGNGNESPYMADSLRAAAIPLALSPLLPDAATVAARKLDFEALSRAQPNELAEPTTDVKGAVALTGTLVWSDEASGWITHWRLDADGKRYLWQVSGVSFDEAFRNAMRGTARILSGNGTP
ncbi:DUF2066 domain-containing protein [Ensifer sp. MJa1]|uniref:DUF2066 domain-containing protein n=1 Tax=Ensifer sp. MJa1 TaxID=2919888 RepID=UPI00300BAB31